MKTYMCDFQWGIPSYEHSCILSYEHTCDLEWCILRYKHRCILSYEHTCVFQRGIHAALLSDAITLYAAAVNATIANNGDPTNITDIANHLYGVTIEGRQNVSVVVVVVVILVVMFVAVVLVAVTVVGVLELSVMQVCVIHTIC